MMKMKIPTTIIIQNQPLPLYAREIGIRYRMNQIRLSLTSPNDVVLLFHRKVLDLRLISEQWTVAESSLGVRFIKQVKPV